MKNDLFKLIEIRPQIFLMKFKSQYEMNMHFLRYTEFTETVSRKFKGKAFKIFDFMKWYSLKNGRGTFTYNIDWGGHNTYNIVYEDIYKLGIPDPNDYDKTMKEVYDYCKSKYDKFSIIGAYGAGSAIKHEIAHGLFYLNKEYKKKVLKLVNALPKELVKQMKINLKELGYNAIVMKDEINAYMSTGFSSAFSNLDINNLDKPFRKLFKEYYNK